MNNIILIIDNIRSVHNVGAMFRTSEAAGVSEIVLVGITPTPFDRFGRIRSDLSKSAVGAELMVPWRQYVDTSDAINYIQGINANIVALEISKDSVDYKQLPPREQSQPWALVVGNENTGVSQQWIDASDIVAHIPMYGEKESLNVSTACGIALFHLTDL